MIFFHASPTFHSGLHAHAVADNATFCANRKRKGCHNNNTKTNKNKDENSTTNSTDTTGQWVWEKTPLHREETSEKATISLDVTGFDEDQLNVEFDAEDDILTISGERTNKLGDTFMTRRRLALKADTYDEESINATLQDGVLEVTILKKPVPNKKRRVEIVSILGSTPPAPVPVETNTESTSPSAENEVSDQNTATKTASENEKEVTQSTTSSTAAEGTTTEEDAQPKK